MAPCEALTAIGKPEVTLSELMTTVTKNYTRYHSCAEATSAWQQWYQEQRVGSFLDKVRTRARAPELVRVTQKPLAKICVSNIYARSQLDIQSRLHSIGITIIQDLHAVFEIQYTTKLRIQSASLTVWVQSDQKLTDLLQGITSLDVILVPATITMIEDDSEVIHQMELKPNKQIDRRGMPFLTNICSTLGASEAQILTWILLCTSSQIGQQWTEESAFLAHPDGPAHLTTIWGNKNQRWHILKSHWRVGHNSPRARGST
jgi:hypothetical protein